MTHAKSDMDFQRAQEAIRRGWVPREQVSRCLGERGTAQSILDVLLAQGWLDAGQVRDLQAATVSLRGSGEFESVGEDSEVLAVGDVINGRYVIEKLLPPGGFGRVYVCRTRDDGRRVALKTPLRKYVRSSEHLEMFRQEALRWMRLGSHPNIVLAYGHEEYLRLPFIVMELIENGRSLHSVLYKETGTDWKNALHYGVGIVRGLEHAGSSAGLVHRDLKPLNVMVTSDDVAKVTDFGLSLVRGMVDQAVVGTPPYMAPEQWTSPESVDVRSDVYAFGIILFELATGRRPYPDHRTAEEYMEDHLSRMVPDPRLLRKDVPEPLARLILECLEKEMTDRPSGFGRLRGELERLHSELLGSSAAEAPSDGVPSPVERKKNESSTFHGLGQYKEALQAAEDAVRLDPGYAEAHVVRGNALIELGRVPEAIQSLARAVQLDPRSIPGVVNLARASFAVGERREAKAWLARALALAESAGRLNLLDTASWLFVELESPDVALEVCSRILSLDPKALLTWNMQSILLRRLGRFEEALKSADQTVHLNPRYAKGWSNRATILMQSGRHAEAVASADTALKFEPATVGAYAAKAMALRELGKVREAKNCLKEGLRVVPNNPLLQRALESL